MCCRHLFHDLAAPFVFLHSLACSFIDAHARALQHLTGIHTRKHSQPRMSMFALHAMSHSGTRFGARRSFCRLLPHAHAHAQILAVDWILDRFRTAANVRLRPRVTSLSSIAFRRSGHERSYSRADPGRLLLRRLAAALHASTGAAATLAALNCHNDLQLTVTMFYNYVTQRAVGEVVVEMAGVEGADAAAHDNHSRKD